MVISHELPEEHDGANGNTDVLTCLVDGQEAGLVPATPVVHLAYAPVVAALGGQFEFVLGFDVTGIPS